MTHARLVDHLDRAAKLVVTRLDDRCVFLNRHHHVRIAHNMQQRYAGGSQRLTRAVGKAKAMDMHLTGRFMSAEEAERAGLVSRVVPARQLAGEARAAAEKIAEKSQLSVLAIKDAVNRSQELPLTEGLGYERRLFEALFSTEDQAEGMAACREKREPQYRDR